MNKQTAIPKPTAVSDELDRMDAEREARMRIWNAVCRTDPRHTKPVEFGRKFTAIDAHYQIQRATEMFGPVGEGWGYETGGVEFVDGLVIVPVTLWHGSRDKSFGPIYGSTTLRDRKGNIDKDAPKKATTDALTKALSQLGFNADVFLGKFDDNKYVAEVTAEFTPKPDAITTDEKPPNKRVVLDGPFTSPSTLKAAAKEFVRTLEGCGDEDELMAFLETTDAKEFMAQLERDMPSWWSGDETMPAEFIPLEIRVANRKRELAELESVRR